MMSNDTNIMFVKSSKCWLHKLFIVSGVMGLVSVLPLHAQEFYAQVNLSSYSNHYRYFQSPIVYQPTYTKFALLPGSGVYVGYKFDAKNSVQVGYTLLAFNWNESANMAGKFPTSQYARGWLSSNFHFRYLRSIYRSRFFDLRLAGGMVIQFNRFPGRDTIYYSSNYPIHYEVQIRTSKTLLLGELGFELERRIGKFGLIAGYNWFIGPSDQSTTLYSFKKNGNEFQGVRHGDGFGMNVFLGLRVYVLKLKSGH